MKQTREKPTEQLSKDEQLRLMEMKQAELQKFRQIAMAKFDDSKNWSIMIKQKDNMLRNKIMQNVKYEQLKKRNLHDFVRKAREDIIKSRPPR